MPCGLIAGAKVRRISAFPNAFGAFYERFFPVMANALEMRQMQPNLFLPSAQVYFQTKSFSQTLTK
jgi:hypothetical protein